ncbi:alanine racemase [Flavobacterium sp. ASW18X]|uniref:alanine racemase n=1 Tax=Flavobacterium sp. ASW18X TaxID=2572595 RepID=UPI0010ADD906|nr:alanine racemase [Flavobacterium sp. ASW18X]TKD65195.1 alanine racemase [Flavobacterium sp. ASW18X]
MHKITETTLVIDLGALAHNFNYLKSKLSKSTKFLGVVKAFAYGSDMVAIAKKLEALGADYLAVAYAKEGVLLRDAGVQLPILVLHPQIGNLEVLIERCLEPNLYSLRIAKAFIALAEEKQQTAYPVHFKFNTGLNRLGFSQSDAPEGLAMAKQTKAIKIASVFSHLAASEDLEEKVFSQEQIKAFNAFVDQTTSVLGYTPKRHMCNTSGIFNYPGAHFDMVRSGIGLYGYGNEAKYDAELQPVATLKTVISQIHIIKPGDSVGYNRSFTTDKTVRTATLPLGHADGISRQYGGGQTFVLVNGQLAPIIGNTCMDMIMINVSNIHCQEGDEVTLFGPALSANTVATTAKTISYELLTGIAARVTRKIID